MSEEPKEGLPELGSPYLGPVDDGDDYDLAASTKPRPNRITVVETVYHQVGNDKPMSVESRFSRAIESDEQVYERRHKNSQVATAERKRLDYGWVDSPGMVVIRNDESDSESARVLQVSFPGIDKGSFDIPPGESLRCSPSHSIMVRAACETVAFTLHAFPK